MSTEKDGASIAHVGQHTIILLGSTGNLGSYLLDFLLRTRVVSCIICLNRSAKSIEKQRKDFKARGLDLAPLEDHCSRIKFLQAELYKDRFGLDQTIYQDLVKTVDLVLYSAWPVDFNRHISSFQPSIRGVENAVRFCRSVVSNGRAIRMVFVSSVAVASNFASAAPASRSSIPEAELTDWKMARTGYGQSKLLSERILARAASLESPRGVKIAIARLAQLCGPVLHGLQGRWPPQEWVPSLIRSSIMLGKVPDSLGPASRVDWVPVDTAAQILVDVTTHLLSESDSTRDTQCSRHRIGRKQRRDSKPLFVHIVNPMETSWSAVLPAVLRHLPPSVQQCSLSLWVDKLRESQEAGSFEGVDEGLNPAAKLYDMFEDMQDKAIRFPKALAPRFATHEIVEISPTIAALPAVSSDWMELFMQQWHW